MELAAAVADVAEVQLHAGNRAPRRDDRGKTHGAGHRRVMEDRPAATPKPAHAHATDRSPSTVLVHADGKWSPAPAPRIQRHPFPACEMAMRRRPAVSVGG